MYLDHFSEQLGETLAHFLHYGIQIVDLILSESLFFEDDHSQKMKHDAEIELILGVVFAALDHPLDKPVEGLVGGDQFGFQHFLDGDGRVEGAIHPDTFNQRQ